MEEKQESLGVGALSRERSAAAAPSSGLPAPRFRWFTRVVIPAGILVIAGGLLLGAMWNSLIPATPVSAVPVVERATRGALPGAEVLQAAGWIEADPYLTHVSALTNGVVREILVLEGDSVEEGQVIARLVADDARLALRAAEAEVANQRAMVAEARARLNETQTNWDNPVERNRATAVAAAELNESRSLLNELEAQIIGSAAETEQLRQEHERFISLRASQTISESEYSNVRTAWESQAAQLEALHHRRDVVQAQIERQGAEVTAATENERLRTAERQALETAQATLARAEANLEAAQVSRDEAQLRVDRLEVRAPITGVVVQRHCEPGAQVMIGADDRLSAAVVSLYDPANIQVRVDVPLADAGLVAVGQSAEVSVDALPDARFEGTVTRILHIADIQKNTLQVKVAIRDPRPLLRPEMLARVRFLARSQRSENGEGGSSLHAPAQTVRDGRAWVVEEYDGSRGIARPRAVGATGPEQDGWVPIAEGLRPGDLVITSPPLGMRDGQRVSVRLDSN